MNNEELILHYLDLVHKTAFPYPKYDEDRLKKVFLQLQKKDLAKTSNIGLELVRQFHPSIWRCNIKNHLSPLDAWYDDQLVYKTICNRLKYLNTDSLTPENIRNGFSISKLAPKVSIFRPALAKYLIAKYLADYTVIFDPCAGFSGRMLGTCTLNKKYIGQDINSVTIKESKELRDYLKLNASLEVKDSIYDSGEYDCLFTCPPYGDREIWHQDIEVLSADEWIDICLANYKCKTYLFVVDNTVKYADHIVEEIENKSYFYKTTEKIVFI